MRRRAIDWFAGEPALCDSIEKALEEALLQEIPLQTNHRRTLYRIRLDAGDRSGTDAAFPKSTGSPAFPPEAVVKIYHRRSGARRVRDAIKRAVGHSALRREWSGFETLTRLGLPTAAPLAWGRSPSGDEILVTRFLDGVPLGQAIPRLEPQRVDELAAGLAHSIQRLHAAGSRHGDLHLGNLLYSDSEAVFLDPQRLRPGRSRAGFLADWGQLDASLERAGQRGASGEAAAFESFRHALREASGVADQIDDARIRFDRDYQRGRGRRVLRPGRNWEALRWRGDVRGLKESAIDEEELRRSFETLDEPERPRSFETLDHDWRDRDRRREAAERKPTIRRDGRVRVLHSRLGDRPVIVKRVETGTLLRSMADRFRGSAGGRAFRHGQSHRLLGEHCARPLAFVEKRRFGLPIASWCWMESVGEADLDEFVSKQAGDGPRIALRLGDWLAGAHARGLRHRDLKASNIRVEATAEHIRFWWIDLEDLGRLAPLPTAERIEALAQINASLPDQSVDGAARWRALEAYSRRLPFDDPLEDIAREITKASLDRNHRWRGTDCDVSRPS